MRILFMGTPEFSCSILKTLIESRHEVVAVVTQTDKAKDRGKKIAFTPVKELALENNIPVFQPEKIKNNVEFLEEMKALNPDISVVAAYGKILPKELLDLPKFGSINTHASLLPRLRGAAPIQQSIIDGEEKTGVTIMKMDVGLDTGDMLLKGEVEIGKMNYEELHNELAKIGSKLIIEALDLIEEGKAIPVKQDDSLATYAGLISKKDGAIDFNKKAVEIERLIRGFDPWPGAYCEMEGQGQVKLWKACVVDSDMENDKVGIISSCDNKGFTVTCKVGSLYVTEIQVPGKKRVSVKDYLLGHKIQIGTKLVKSEL